MVKEVDSLYNNGATTPVNELIALGFVYGFGLVASAVLVGFVVSRLMRLMKGG